ncbi:MAG TPA: S-layer homology domain-containing protein [Candidatus Paenibacillus intestinavium]|nr:S-layer homology domain-containing protein [Candidatus Paenibacillus intestinavium]
MKKKSMSIHAQERKLQNSQSIVQRMKKPFVKTLVTAVILSQIAGATSWERVSAANETISPNTINAANITDKQIFLDVSTNFWAHKYISKLALLGVVEGDQYGNFNPNASISRQEVIIMALRLMGYENVTPQTSSLVLDVDSWAQDWVKLAVEKGLINLTEETKVVNWGAQPATREWVTKLVIRSVDKEAEAAAWAKTPLLFADVSSMSDATAGYVNVATQLEIIHGYPDNTFKPLNQISRAEVAKVVSIAEIYTAQQSGKVIKGAFISLENDTLTLLSDAAKVESFKVNANAIIYGSNGLNSTLKQGQRIAVILQNGGASFVDATEIQPQELQLPSEKVEDGKDGQDGAKGDTGSTGPAGSRGPVGPAGAVGAVGAAGPTGAVGPAGPAGAVGPAGPAGAVGSAGSAGAVGPAGPAGAVGSAGPAGAVGPAGPAGAVGPVGPAGAGLTGIIAFNTLDAPSYAVNQVVTYDGSTYVVNSAPPTGTPDTSPNYILLAAAGTPGAQGIQGPQGIQGNEGPQGPEGPEGSQGPAGAGGGAIIPYSSGKDPITLTTLMGGLTGTSAVVGFGSSSPLAILPSDGMDLSNEANYAFIVPRTGTITSLSAFFSSTTAMNLLGTVNVTAQLYQSTGPDNIFTAIAGTKVELVGGYTGVVNVGDAVTGTVDLDVPVTAGTRLLLVFSAETTDLLLANVLTGHVSAGVSID